jgi:hypothetical protein
LNKYDQPLAVSSVQTVLPAITKDGLVRGFYPIASTTFDGSETEFTLSDGVVVPLSVVTLDPDPSSRFVFQYVAAVFPSGLPYNYQPWSSADLIRADEGSYSWYTLPTQGWMHHFGKGVMINAIQSSLNTDVEPPTGGSGTPVPVDTTMNWAASVPSAVLSGDCSFFDFNWMTLFSSKSALTPVRISVNGNPVDKDGNPVFRATVVGNPTATGTGVQFDTVRVMKLSANVLGAYTFNLRVTDDKGGTTDVVLTVTVL